MIQTITYAPNFISTIVMCGMLILFLSPSVGIINTVIKSFGGEAVNFMAKKEYWRHLYVWAGVWQGMGWSSVIYFAALSGISPELHEAAKCDGATKFQIIRYRESLCTAERPEPVRFGNHFHLRVQGRYD